MYTQRNERIRIQWRHANSCLKQAEEEYWDQTEGWMKDDSKGSRIWDSDMNHAKHFSSRRRTFSYYFSLSHGENFVSNRLVGGRICMTWVSHRERVTLDPDPLSQRLISREAGNEEPQKSVSFLSHTHHMWMWEDKPHIASLAADLLSSSSLTHSLEPFRTCRTSKR